MGSNLMERLNNIGMVLTFCGACGENYPCDKSIRDTLNANGLQAISIEELKGLSHKTPNYGRDSEYSPFGQKIRELIKADPQKWEDASEYIVFEDLHCAQCGRYMSNRRKKIRFNGKEAIEVVYGDCKKHGQRISSEYQ